MYLRCEKSKQFDRVGMTLVELLIAMTVMVMIVSTIGILSKTVQSTSEYSEATTNVIQNGRVCAERISRLVTEAVANEYFPGVLVIPTIEGGYDFPDTIVIWHPEGSPSDPSGLPLFCELVVICVDPWSPSTLVEMTSPDDYRVVPQVGDTSLWEMEIESLKTSPYSTWNPLTHMVRSAPIDGTPYSSYRGAVRFETREFPSVTQRQSYRSDVLAWESVNWVQDVVGTNRGLCQTQLRFEIQLLPHTVSGMLVQGDAIPTFGSAAVCYLFKR